MGTQRPPGQRLVLQRLELADLNDFHLLHTTLRAPGSVAPAAVAADLPYTVDHPDVAYSRTVLEDIIADWSRDGLGYLGLHTTVEDHRAGRLIGVGGVQRAGPATATATGDGSWNVYYRIAADHRGMGYAGALVAAAARRCAHLEPEAVLSARIHPANTASRRVAEKLGLQLVYEGLTAGGEPELLYEGLASAVAADSPDTQRWRVDE